MKKKALEKVLVFSVTLMLCFLLLEIGLRVKERRSFKISEGEYVQHGNSYRLKRNATKFHNWSSRKFTVNTNSLGARDRTAGEKDMRDRPYVVFLGDSQVFAEGVDYEDSFVGVFADYTAEIGIEVLNLGVVGYYLLEQEEVFKDMIKSIPRKPLAVFYTFNASSLNCFDYMHGTIVVKNGYLFYEATWKSAYVRMMLTNNLSIYVFFRDIFWSLYRSWSGQGGEVRLPKHFDLYSRESRLYDADIAVRLEDHISRFQSYCDELGIRMVYLYVPIGDSFTIRDVVTQLSRDPDDYDIFLYERFMEDYCTKHGYPFLNPMPLLKKHYDQDKELDLGKNPHYNEFGHRVVGEYIIEQVFVENELF